MKYIKTVDVNTTDLKGLQRGQWVKSGRVKGVYIGTKSNGIDVIMWHGGTVKPSESVISRLIKFVRGE